MQCKIKEFVINICYKLFSAVSSLRFVDPKLASSKISQCVLCFFLGRKIRLGHPQFCSNRTLTCHEVMLNQSGV